MFLLLLARLKSRDPDVRRAAMVELVRTASIRTLRLLQAMAADLDPEIRRLAVEGLARIDEQDRVAPLLSALNDPDPLVAQAAIQGLKRGPASIVTGPLEPLLKHGHAGVRAAAALALESLGWTPSLPEEEMNFLVARGQFTRLARFGAAAIPTLESVLVSDASSASLQAVEALGQIEDSRALPALLQVLKSENPALCVRAVDALGRRGGKEMVEPLRGMTEHANPHVRSAAVEALGRLHAVEAADTICALLQDEVWDVRRQAAEILGRLQAPQTVQPLTQVLNDPDADVREAAINSLGNLEDRQAIGPLVLVLKDPSSDVRRAAAGTLKRLDANWFKRPEAQAALQELQSQLRDAEPAAQYFVRQFLASLGPLEMPSATVPDNRAVSSEVKRHRLAVSFFENLLNHADRDLRQAAAEALGRLGDGPAKEALLRRHTDSDPAVREAIQDALLALETAQSTNSCATA